MPNEQYPPYAMVIEWSAEDDCYIVTLPELGDLHTHGATYEEAARMGQELIESIVDVKRDDGAVLPAPRLFGGRKTLAVA